MEFNQAIFFSPKCHYVCSFVILMLMGIKVRDLYTFIKPSHSHVSVFANVCSGVIALYMIYCTIYSRSHCLACEAEVRHMNCFSGVVVGVNVFAFSQKLLELEPRNLSHAHILKSKGQPFVQFLCLGLLFMVL